MYIIGVEEITNILGEIIQKEINSDKGLLSDVQTFVRVTEEDTLMNTPLIWMTQNKIEPSSIKAGLSHKLFLSTQFEFVCLYDDIDALKAESRCLNLATRVVAAVDKNLPAIRHKGLIHDYNLIEIYPPGLVNITNKQESIPAASAVIEIIFPIDWKHCAKYEKKRVFLSVPEVVTSPSSDAEVTAYVVDEDNNAVILGDVEFELESPQDDND